MNNLVGHPIYKKSPTKYLERLALWIASRDFYPKTYYVSFTILLPHFQYSILTWGFEIGRLETLQNRAVHIITNSSYNAHTDPLFKKLSLLKVKELFRLNVLKLYYKFRKGNLPVYTISMLTYANAAPAHDYSLRMNSILENVTTTTSSGENCIRFHLPVKINNTESSVLDKISTHSYEGFAFFVKHFPRYWPFVRGIHRSRWIPRTMASDVELWCFLWSASE